MDKPPVLVSVGYEGRSAEELVALMVAERVDVVVDVRLNPISRKPGLSKTKLAAELAAAGVGYLHVRALGNPRENRDPFWTGHVNHGVAVFRSLMEMPVASASLDDLARVARESRVALLCFERDHSRCHRQVLTEQLTVRVPDAEVAFV